MTSPAIGAMQWESGVYPVYSNFMGYDTVNDRLTDDYVNQVPVKLQTATGVWMFANSTQNQPYFCQRDIPSDYMFNGKIHSLMIAHFLAFRHHKHKHVQTYI